MNNPLLQARGQADGRKWVAPFFSMWGGQALSLLGSQMVQFALVWWLTKTTGSATVLATATLAALIPQVLIGPVAGVIVDRFSRKWVMILADSLAALGVVVLAILFWTGTVQPWQIYLLMFLRSAAQGFHWPAMQASATLMVPQAHLARIQGLNQMLNGLMNILAAPFGALLITTLPMQAVLAVDIVTALLAVLALLFVHVPQPLRATDGDSSRKTTTLWADFKVGWHYVWGWPGLMLILVMATLINLLLTPSGALQPILVTHHFGGSAAELAWLESAWGVGAVTGGIALSVWGGFRRRIVTSILGIILLGLSVLAVGFVPASMFRLAVALVFMVGFINPIVNGPLFAVVQAVVAPEMQGRVFTLIGSFASAMSPLGLILAGPLADRLGVQTWYIIGGAVTLLLGIVAFMVPAIMNIENRAAQTTLAEVENGTGAARIVPSSPSTVKISGD